MYIELNSKSRSLGGMSDLTVIAPIRKGLVPSLESITYKTRVKRLLEALQLLRESSHEYSIFRSVSDSAERVARIHSFRVAVIEPTGELLLAVTFDGARESYIRVLHQRIGTLLDLLFCNTEGHVPAYGNSMAEWDAWIERIQVKTDFFYGRPRQTSEDVLFLRDEEQERRSNSDALAADLASVRRATPRAETAAWVLAKHLDRIVETGRQGVQTIAVLHRLTAWFIPNTPDGDFLHRAARDLLPEFLYIAQSTPARLEETFNQARIRFPEQIDWFLRPSPVRTVPALPTAAPANALKARIQGGILDSYEGITHGALLLMAFKPGADSTPFWTLVNAMRTAADKQPKDGRLVCNVAFTHEGLRKAGLTQEELGAFPLEFRAGMEARSSVLGDVRTDHPRRWRLPAPNWGRIPKVDEAIELATVHVVLQLRIGNPPGMAPEVRIYNLDDARHPLYADIQAISGKLKPCMELLSLEPMVRHLETPEDPLSRAREHFGYVDGNGQPTLDPAAPGRDIYKDNLVHPGEFLVGQANAAEPPAGEGQPEVSSWLRDGSFLVVRKLAQDVELFDQIDKAGAVGGLDEDTVAAKLMGRRKNSDPLAAPGSGNDFTFQLDAEGRRCPLHAHIRRANPRSPLQNEPPELPGGRAPRIMRRSMSFGPLFDRANPANPDNPKPRGMIFMAYNARIAEQFEVVQRWLAGGNSTGGYSGRSDPFVGVPASGEKRVFSFECPLPLAGGTPRDAVHRVTLDGDASPEVLARTMVRLEWGAYLFTPGLPALADLGKRAAASAAQWPWSADRGRAEIDRLLAPTDPGADRVAAWKAALEDPDAQKTFLSASIWAAIRRDFGGVLRTPYGVLAASHTQAMAVLTDAQANYSVAGYRERTAPTLGDIYLGLDDRGPGCPYRGKSEKTNQAIQAVTQTAACDAARALARASLARLIQREKDYALARGEPQWQLTFGAKEVWDEVLEGLCRDWFGLPDAGQSGLIQPGAFRWDWDPRSAVLYPGNFVSPSRYIFQPQPGNEVRRVGSLHGSTMNAAFRAWVKEVRDQGPAPTAPLAKAIFDAFPRPAGGDDMAVAAQDALVAETLLGALIGFLPTVEGNLRQSLNEWLLDGTFWSLRAALQMRPGGTPVDLAPIRDALHRSMQLRPSPEVVWRRATQSHRLGDVQVQAGETVVVAIVSATHELMERKDDDISPIFGGVRPPAFGRPTHACPGYEAATGTLLGILTALLESAESMRPTPSPLSFRMEGPVPVQPAPGGGFVPFWVTEAAPVGAGRVLLVAGDSWLDYDRRADLTDVLREKHGFIVDDDFAETGKELARLAADRELDAIVARFKALAQDGRTPSAILISAGGNDVVGDVLLKYVLPFGAGPGGLSGKLDAIMDGVSPEGAMRAQVRKILTRLGQDCIGSTGKPVPVVWQGYDHPIPDGRLAVSDLRFCPLSALCKSLSKLGYTDLGDGYRLMLQIVDRYNTMLAGFATHPTYKSYFTHADLRDTLVNTLAGGAYKTDWTNEMHATPAGFEKLADKLVARYLVPVLV
jgi:Dyp-type peroxidase family